MGDLRDIAADDTPLDPSFEIRVHPVRELVIVEVCGELHLTTAPQVQETLNELADSGFKEIVLDLRAVTFMDSTGIRVLIEMESRADVEGFRFAVSVNGDQPTRVLSLLGMTDRPRRIEPRDLPRG